MTPAPFVRLSELDPARAEASPAVRLDALRRAGRVLRARLARTGPALAVRSIPMVTFPYPTRFALGGFARSPAPSVMLRNTMQVVQVAGDDGTLTILVNPTDPVRSRATPFFARQIARYGDRLTKTLFSTIHHTPATALAELGVAPGDVDYVAFDHLHAQDLRGLFGTNEAEPGNPEPTPALLPRAKLLVQRAELIALERLHPLQRPWYVEAAIRGVSADRFVVFDGDYQVGPGLAIVRTPGHTLGNQTIVLTTDRGLWTISENGVSVDAYAPHASEIPGLRRAAREHDLEVILNANSREHTLEQHTSMILEKTLADPSQERPEFPQHLASSEMIASLLAPGLSPTHRHGGIEHGRLRAGPERDAPPLPRRPPDRVSAQLP